MNIIIFVIGCLVGGFFGVLIMSLIQINRINGYKEEDK